MDPSDDTLIARTLDGSLDDFERLMSRYQRLVYKVASGYTRGRDDTLDVAQNVFLKAYDRLHSYRGPGSFQAWLMRIAYHEGVNWVRSQRRHQGHDPLDTAAELAADDDVEKSALGGERRRQMLGAVRALSPRGRLAVLLRYFQEMPVREVAAVLGCSEGVAKSILFRSVRKMRDAIAAGA